MGFLNFLSSLAKKLWKHRDALKEVVTESADVYAEVQKAKADGEITTEEWVKIGKEAYEDGMAIAMVKRDWKRAALHIPHGIIIGLLCCNPLTWKLAAIAWKIFLEYELNEDSHIKDQAWHDLFGVLIGISIIALTAIPVGFKLAQYIILSLL